MPTPEELDRSAQGGLVAGSPLHQMVTEHRKPKPDSAEWWQEVAQGLGVTIHVMRGQRDELLAALKELRDAVKAEPAMNHQRYDALGVRVNRAIANAESVADSSKASSRVGGNKKGESLS